VNFALRRVLSIKLISKMEEIVCRPYGTLSRPIERSEPNESISLQSNLPPAAASPHRLENNADGSETTESGITGRKNPDLTCRHFIVGLSMIGATMAWQKASRSIRSA
jgi:hypothetical protein